MHSPFKSVGHLGSNIFSQTYSVCSFCIERWIAFPGQDEASKDGNRRRRLSLDSVISLCGTANFAQSVTTQMRQRILPKKIQQRLGGTWEADSLTCILTTSTQAYTASGVCSAESFSSVTNWRHFESCVNLQHLFSNTPLKKNTPLSNVQFCGYVSVCKIITFDEL